jgi:peptidoglycan/LPS O-acetylase OafA/YrhL
LYAIPTIGLIYGLTSPGEHLLKRIFEKPLFQWLGEISFAAYLVHVPIGQKLRQFLGSRFEIGHWSVTFVLVLISTVVAASALHYFFERPLRNAIRKLAS